MFCILCIIFHALYCGVFYAWYNLCCNIYSEHFMLFNMLYVLSSMYYTMLCMVFNYIINALKFMHSINIYFLFAFHFKYPILCIAINLLNDMHFMVSIALYAFHFMNYILHNILIALKFLICISWMYSSYFILCISFYPLY